MASNQIVFYVVDGLRYGECMRNHAVHLMGYAVDGCGEYVARNGEDMHCDACGCHRNFHRRLEMDGLIVQRNPVVNGVPHLPELPRAAAAAHNDVPFGAAPPSPRARNVPLPPQRINNNRAAAGRRVARRGMNNRLRQQNEEEMGGGEIVEEAEIVENELEARGRMTAGVMENTAGRERLSAEGRERLRDFATRLGWRSTNRNEEDEIRRFFNGMGVADPQMMMNWIYNNRRSRNHPPENNNSNPPNSNN